MRDSKSFASLSSGLLARKGAAKPAMRPQGFGNFGSSLEDLGWDDMGQGDEPEPQPHQDFHQPSPVSALTPSVARLAPEPAVVAHQRHLREAFEAPEVHEVAADAPEAVEVPEAAEEAKVLHLPRRRGAVKTGTAKAAFTLRLDPERHLKLRLACAINRVSAQQLVTGAVDNYLNSLPELDALANCVPAESAKRSR
jgi:predicted HicB family RNase H-like nuclease